MSKYILKDSSGKSTKILFSLILPSPSQRTLTKLKTFYFLRKYLDIYLKDKKKKLCSAER